MRNVMKHYGKCYECQGKRCKTLRKTLWETLSEMVIGMKAL